MAEIKIAPKEAVRLAARTALIMGGRAVVVTGASEDAMAPLLTKAEKRGEETINTVLGMAGCINTMTVEQMAEGEAHLAAGRFFLFCTHTPISRTVNFKGTVLERFPAALREQMVIAKSLQPTIYATVDLEAVSFDHIKSKIAASGGYTVHRWGSTPTYVGAYLPSWEHAEAIRAALPGIEWRFTPYPEPVHG